MLKTVTSAKDNIRNSLFEILIHSSPQVADCDSLSLQWAELWGKVSIRGVLTSFEKRGKHTLNPCLRQCETVCIINEKCDSYWRFRIHAIPNLSKPLRITSSVSSASFSAGSSSLRNHRTSAASRAAARSPATRRHRKSIKT